MKKIFFNNDVYELLLSRKDITKEVKKIATKIAIDYRTKSGNLVLLFVLNGGMYFGVELSQALEEIGLKHKVDIINLKSYNQRNNKGSSVTILNSPYTHLRGKDILIVEDIIDRGDTMNFLYRYLLGQDYPPRTIEFCSFFIKRGHNPLDFNLKYGGRIVGLEWIIGYGMDSNGFGRGLKDIWIKSDS